MRINHNIASLNTYRQLSTNTANGSKSLEKLSSGLRINRAGDDAAGLAISEKMRGQVRGLDQASRNAQDGISMIQTAEGGLNEVHSILQRMRELSVQASTDVLATQDSTAIGDELVALRDEIDRIGNTTDFNGKKLLNGNLSTSIDTSNGTATTLAVGAQPDAGNVSVSNIDVSGAAAGKEFTFSAGGAGEISLSDGTVTQKISMADADFAKGNTKELNFDKLGVKVQLTAINTGTANGVRDGLDTEVIATSAAVNGSTAVISVGANAASAESISVSFDDMRSSALDSNVGSLTKTSVGTVDDAKTMTTSIDSAIAKVSTQRSKLGAIQNRLEHTIANLGTSGENLTAAESRIRDVDMAKEMMEFTKNNILSQAAQAMLAQANQQPQGVLQLLR